MMNNSAPSPSPASGQRLEWLDAMRGTTMLLVVAYHVAQFSFELPLKHSSSLPLLVLLRMPMFFFVSGFLAYSSRARWTAGEWLATVGKKVRLQVVPTLFFLVLFVLLMRKPSWEAILGMLKLPTKGGFWFTWALLLMFIAYYTLEALLWQVRQWWQRRYPERHLSAAPLWGVAIAWVASVLWYETAYLPAHFRYLREPFWQWSSLSQVALYFQFFLFGNLVRRRWTQVQRLFDTRGFFAVVALVAIICCGDALKWHTLRMAWANLPRTVAMYALLIIVVMTFRYYAPFFSSATRVGRALIYVGQRTLDIYLLHFFFLPALPMVGKWMDGARPGFLVEQVLTLGVAAFVVLMCCLVSHVMRVSPLLRYYLFGRK